MENEDRYANDDEGSEGGSTEGNADSPIQYASAVGAVTLNANKAATYPLVTSSGLRQALNTTDLSVTVGSYMGEGSRTTINGIPFLMRGTQNGLHINAFGLISATEGGRMLANGTATPSDLVIDEGGKLQNVDDEGNRTPAISEYRYDMLLDGNPARKFKFMIGFNKGDGSKPTMVEVTGTYGEIVGGGAKVMPIPTPTPRPTPRPRPTPMPMPTEPDPTFEVKYPDVEVGPDGKPWTGGALPDKGAKPSI